MSYTKDNGLGFVMGCRAMLDAFIVAYHRGVTFKDAVGELGKWNDEVLNPWRAKVEDAEEEGRFCLCDLPIPEVRRDALVCVTGVEAVAATGELEV